MCAQLMEWHITTWLKIETTTRVLNWKGHSPPLEDLRLMSRNYSETNLKAKKKLLRNGILHFGNVSRHEFPWESQRFIEVITCTVFIYIFNCYYFLHLSQGQDYTLSIFWQEFFMKRGIHMHFEIRCGETKFCSNSWSTKTYLQEPLETLSWGNENKALKN